MPVIDQHTKIAFLIRNHPDALETIIRISPKFNKLRNPVLRKLLAGRASISMAAAVAGCSVNEFLDQMKTLGFQSSPGTSTAEIKKAPVWLMNAKPGTIVDLDVREFLQKDRDPLPHIMKKLRSLKKGQILKIINSFEPGPLMDLLAKQGDESFAETIDPQLVETYFSRRGEERGIPEVKAETTSDWEESLSRFEGKMEVVDVRQLEMPGPMMRILEELDKLPAGKALFIYHKRIPLFLIPELAERKFAYRLKEISENEVHLLIFRDQ